MPKLKEGQFPKYRLHKQSGQAIVTLSGRDFLLGKHGSAVSKQEYRRVTGEWLAGQGIATPITAATPPDLTVAELVLAFWRHAGLTKNGVMDPALLYEPPYTDLDDAGLDGLFDDEQADKIVHILTAIQHNAEPTRASA